MVFYNKSKTIDELRTKFYQYETQYKKFSEIDEEKRSELEQEINSFCERNDIPKNGIQRYMEVIGFLTHSSKFKTMSFDERLVMFIEAVDPNLDTYKLYLTADKNNLSSNTRNVLGFFDMSLLKYEEHFYSKFIKDKELMHGVKRDFSSTAEILFNFVKGFDTVTEDQSMKLDEKIEQWKSTMQENDGVNTVFFNALFQGKCFGGLNFQERVMFIIRTLDPDLKALRISCAECKTKDIEAKCKEELGFYSSRFIELEKLYKEKFMKDVIIDFLDTEKHI